MLQLVFFFLIVKYSNFKDLSFFNMNYKIRNVDNTSMTMH